MIGIVPTSDFGSFLARWSETQALSRSHRDGGADLTERIIELARQQRANDERREQALRCCIGLLRSLLMEVPLAHRLFRPVTPHPSYADSFPPPEVFLSLAPYLPGNTCPLAIRLGWAVWPQGRKHDFVTLHGTTVFTRLVTQPPYPSRPLDILEHLDAHLLLTDVRAGIPVAA